MRMKRILYQVLPPAVYLLGKKVYSKIVINKLTPILTGYENSELVESVIRKTIIAKKRLITNRTVNQDAFRVFLPFALANEKIVNVVEIGGGSGYHYFNALVGNVSKELNWTILETQELCNQAKNRTELSEIQFISDLKSISGNLNSEIDLIYCCGSLQYVPDPISTIKQICELNPKYIFITRTPFSPDEGIYTYMQSSPLSSNGPSSTDGNLNKKIVQYEMQLVPESVIQEIIKQNYSIEMYTDEDQAVHHFKGKTISYRGIWAVRKDLA
jgi:putative methyltransferase (TIGR04325 family)